MYMDMFVALSDPTRRAILEILASSGELTASAIYEQFPVSPQAISQHLKVLKCAGLVQDRAAGTRRIYQLNPHGVAALKAELDVFWGKALDAYKLITDEERDE